MFKLTRFKRIAAAAAATALAGGGLALAAALPASATTLTCTNLAHATNPPIGCGGAQLAYSAKGTLDLGVLGLGNSTGNYWNSPVGFLTSSQSNIREDFTVFAVDGNVHSGPGGLGSYVVMYTPDGNIPTFMQGGVTKTNTTPTIGTSFTVGTNVYCISVENLNNGPHGALRWRTVLRNCNTDGTFEYGVNNGTGPFNSVSHSHANRFQVWSPVSGSAGLEMINLSLSKDHPHGFNKSNTPYVLDDSGFGGNGTWGLAFPENDGLNQEFSIIGCTDPITALSTGYQFCP